MVSLRTPLALNAEAGIPVPRFQSLEQWLQWQEGLHFTAIDLGLDRVRRVAERMDLLRPGFTVISVAGTNGKGSSVTLLETIFRNSGYKTGKYTSPHLLRYNERVCLDGEAVGDSLLCDTFERIDQARGDISLTYFEFGTLAALDIFHRQEVEIAVLEVGLGGRLDAVNILDADAALVTSIDIDHENWLGPDRESIGREKAGIFRRNICAVCSDPEPPQSVLECASEVGAELKLLGRDYTYSKKDDCWSWHSGTDSHEQLAMPNVHDHIQVQNASGVLMLVKCLQDRFPVSVEAIFSSIQDFRLPGRFQIIPSLVPYILDVAHNRESASILAKNLVRLGNRGRTHCVIGMLKDKDHASIIRELVPVVDSWYVADLETERAASAESLVETVNSFAGASAVCSFNDVGSALDSAKAKSQAGDQIVVTGSFLTVKAAITWLE